MDSGYDKANAWMQSPEGVELNDAVCSVLAHELGGIAAALDLRSAALVRTIPPNDVAALRGLADEVRASSRIVRLLRRPDVSGKLGPAKYHTLDDWWRLASKFSRNVLRGATFNATFGESRINPQDANVLTWVWLASCKVLAEKHNEDAPSVTLGGSTDGGLIKLRAEIPASRVPEAASRWSRYAARVAATIDAAPPRWQHEAGVVSWSFSLPAAGD